MTEATTPARPTVGEGSDREALADDASTTRPLDDEQPRPTLRQVLEALLFVADEPVSADALAAAALGSQSEVEAALDELAASYAADARGFVLRNSGPGWRLYTHDDCVEAVERFLIEGRTARLSQAALETLAVVAYRQPVTRSRIASIRGVASDSALRSLVGRGLVEEIGADESSGATLFGTSDYFLERLGLQSLTDLPSLAPLLPHLDDLADE